MDFFERTFKFTPREYELLDLALTCKIDKLRLNIKEYDELNSICLCTGSQELNDFHLREVAALRFELRELYSLYDRFFKKLEGVQQMKNDLIALIGATAAFISSGIITYKLLNRRHTSGSFRELYEDNAFDVDNADSDFEYYPGADSDQYYFTHFDWAAEGM